MRRRAIPSTCKSVRAAVGTRACWWNTVVSRLTTVFQSTTVGHRVWAYFHARLAWMMAAVNLLARWGLERDEHDMVRLSLAEFSL
jgi:hypothetical protein